MDNDEQQQLDHERKPAYCVRIGKLFRVKCDHHKPPYKSRWSHDFTKAIAMMQQHNHEQHHG